MASNGSQLGWVCRLHVLTRIYSPGSVAFVIIDVVVIWSHMTYVWVPSASPNGHIYDYISILSAISLYGLKWFNWAGFIQTKEDGKQENGAKQILKPQKTCLNDLITSDHGLWSWFESSVL